MSENDRRVALVTGGNRGIGLEVSRMLTEREYQVVLGSRDLARGESVVRTLGATAVQLDVADHESLASAVAQVQERCGRLDVLVNNAGIHYDDWQSAENADWAVIREAFEVNLFGAWRLIQLCAPIMRAKRWGRIVNVSSQGGSLATMGSGTPAYSTSKAALNALTRVAAAELRGTGVLVNAVCPGWTNTDMGGGGRPVVEGAASVVWAVEIPDDGPSGGFFRDGEALDW